MEFEIISKENIKPSFPTPHHLKTFKLCVLDQLIVTPYIPIILYYRNHNSDNILQALERSTVLKKSLSETLTQFYPLAGTIKDNFFIDCNDVGAYYVTVSIHRRLNEFLINPELQLINKFLPCDPSLYGSSAGTHVTNVQVNIFDCGGIAIGLCISHKILDGAALRVFLKGWTNMACGSKQVVYPDLTAPSHFPAKDLWLRDSSLAMCGSWIKAGKCSTKRLVFGSDAIATLKENAATIAIPQPTRVEVVTALILKCAMAASKEVCGYQKQSSFAHAVNLRRKLAVTLSENSICNLIWISGAWCSPNDETTLHSLVDNVHETILKVDTEFVNKAQGDKGFVVMEKFLKEMVDFGSNESKDHFAFTSWCKMGFYDLDFGWGTPIWVTGPVGDGSEVFANLVTLIDTKDGDGIEAWVNLDEQEMEILQGYQELLAYASIDPSPLPNVEVAAVTHSTGHKSGTNWS